jgi:hypothetical protein
MLTLRKNTNYTYTWPVSVPFPADGGLIKKAEFTATFAYHDAQAVQDIRDRIDISSDAISPFMEIITGWSGIKDEDNNEIEFSRDSLAALLKIPSAPYAIMEAYAASLRGQRAKN